ncbi:MAG: pantetheine-phosphate adenylyltransferase [Atopobiaceae bacterium]|jgi:pantetheine-phosphate adenylyltransferase|nr:pantetheine-phosphate adenylyltransferase [Atopobiaceae bacterium]MCH4180637.1 pantetheine-phosphate adenylyltransferase [Atopobiaceae bacterium]MCH4215093.1 pantetheine-phosphate adenylyltransferase [Atopobiaceae bacterium]MCH4230325.1 pantetheine-phosphate adenylyltransferase [Atopobiaceae bacterium]MCH4277261.1 pantetheine-phosphate adenylyltransferase [Atopobiaceae bacterium]
MTGCDIEHVVVPGTFDPITYGHIDVVRRARRFCPKVTVGVAASLAKHGSGPAFPLEERVEMARQALAAEGVVDGVDVIPFTGLLVDFCREVEASAVVKGLRATTDFEYELQQADLNSRMAPDIESIFVMSAPEYGYVSSSIVRELAGFGSDVSLLVPPCVARHLTAHFAS